MRANLCGIVSLHIILGTLSKKYRDLHPTVGELAAKALSFHRNDLLKNGNIIKKGFPVCNLKSGWYHNALLYIASIYGVSGYRLENLTLELVADEFKKLNNDKKKFLAMISVLDDYRNSKIKRKVSHLVV